MPSYKCQKAITVDESFLFLDISNHRYYVQYKTIAGLMAINKYQKVIAVN